MSIAYLVSQYPAPSHTFIRREVEELRNRGLEIQTFSIRSPLAAEIISANDRREHENTWYLLPASPLLLIWVHFLSLIRHPIRYFKTLRLAFHHRAPGISLYPLFYFIEAIYLATELKRRKITHLHNHFAQAGAIVGLLASRYLDIKWSFTVHGTSEFDGAAGSLLNDKLAAAEFVPCVSYFGRAQVMRLVNPKYWSKLFVSRCGVDLENMPQRIEDNHETIRILCVARLSPEKGIIGLLEAFAKARQQNSNLELTIIGEGSDRPIIEQKIIELNLSNNCQLFGRASETEIFKQLTSTDIFVISSFMEGLPVVLMEALAIKVPVIAPCVAGIPELVTDGKSGLLFSPSNWIQLSECLLQLSNDKELRNNLATEGQLRIQAEFDIKRAVEPLLLKFV
jgi:colanic acid/amylovoran biosynthesis glycosyltransferase